MHYFTFEAGGQHHVGVRYIDDNFYDLTALLGPDHAPASALDAAVGGARLEEVVLKALDRATTASDLTKSHVAPDAHILAPIPRPNRILAIGRNYADHAREQGAQVAEEPIVFLKASTSVIGPTDAIVAPPWVGRVDHEVELLVVLGHGGRNVTEERAMELVVGYTIFNDVTARERQRADQERKHPWFRSKSMDTFGPMGPALVTADKIPNPHNLNLECRVNGTLRQSGNTSSMVYSIPTLIAFLSRWFALEPGDVIATGTPAGIGGIVPGDVVECRIDGMGALRNPVVGEYT